jgi:hypothetical protein
MIIPNFFIGGISQSDCFQNLFIVTHAAFS